MRIPSRLPSSAELDRRLEASRALATRADYHIGRAQRERHENNMATIVAEALGLPNGNRGEGRHAKD